MSKRISPEARVIAYFEEATPEMAKVMLGIVTARVRARITPAAARPVKRSHKAKTNAKPVPATAFPGEVAS